jgi:hypothetical protein
MLCCQDVRKQGWTVNHKPPNKHLVPSTSWLFAWAMWQQWDTPNPACYPSWQQGPGGLGRIRPSEAGVGGQSRSNLHHPKAHAGMHTGLHSACELCCPVNGEARQALLSQPATTSSPAQQHWCGALVWCCVGTRYALVCATVLLHECSAVWLDALFCGGRQYNPPLPRANGAEKASPTPWASVRGSADALQHPGAQQHAATHPPSSNSV